MKNPEVIELGSNSITVFFSGLTSTKLTRLRGLTTTPGLIEVSATKIGK